MTGRRWKTASPAQVGQLAHRVIADLLSSMPEKSAELTWAEVLDRVDRRMASDGYRDRAARQLVTAAALAYLRAAPPAPWRFLRAEVALPGVRLDLLWELPDTGRLLVDEVKTGLAGADTPAAREQGLRYLRAIRDQDPHASVRLVSTREPETGQILSDEGSTASPVVPRAPPIR